MQFYNIINIELFFLIFHIISHAVCPRGGGKFKSTMEQPV